MEDNLHYNEFESNENRNKQKRHKLVKNNYGKKLLFVVVLMLAAFAILMSPVFNIVEIEVTGNLNKFTVQQIKEIMQIKEGQNLFAVSKRSAATKLKENYYIEKVVIKKEYPSRIIIDVLERRVRGYVPYMGSYLYIDEYGRVIDVKDSFTEPLPVVNGLMFDRFVLGEKIDAENPEAFEVVVVMAQIMTKYEMLDTVVNIDVSDTENISVKVNKVDIQLGNILNFDEKIRTMSEIMKQIPKDDIGNLDLSDLSKPLVFKFLT